MRYKERREREYLILLVMIIMMIMIVMIMMVGFVFSDLGLFSQPISVVRIALYPFTLTHE